MSNTYQKLFNIKYNNKRFTVFIDEYHRRTFLEINDKDTYTYPSLTDFLYLHSIYNNHNPFVVADSHFFYDEKVKLGLLLLTVSLVLNGYNPNYPSFDVQVKDKEVTIIASSMLEEKIKTQTTAQTNEPITSLAIRDLSQLDSILGYQIVSEDQIHQAIDQNSNIPSNFNFAAHNLVNSITANYPQADLRIFYENIKSIEIEEMTQEEVIKNYQNLYETTDNNVSAFYSSELNKIFASYDMPESSRYHELAHIMSHYYRQINNQIVYRCVYEGYSLDEAMTNRIVDNITKTSSYLNEKLVLDYLIACTNYTFYDYNQRGIWDLIANLRGTYPTVDISYIIASTDSKKDSLIAGEEIKIEEDVELFQELFKMCKMRILPSDGSINDYSIYEPFADFAKLFLYHEDLTILFNYFDEYNLELQAKGYTNLITKEDILSKFNTYQNIKGLVYGKDILYPMLDTIKDDKNNVKEYQVFDNEGHVTTIPNLNYNYCTIKNFHNGLLISIFNNLSDFTSLKFWTNYNTEYNLVNNYQYQPLPIYFNHRLLGEEYIPNLYLRFGLTSNHEIGYIITNEVNDVIYCSSPTLTTTSPSVSLLTFLPNQNIIELNLEKLLSPDNIQKIVSENYFIFPNFSILNNEIIYHKLFMLTLNINQEKITKPLRNLTFSYEEGILVLNFGSFTTSIPLELNIASTSTISLEEVLWHYNKLNREQSAYELDLEETLQLITNYLSDINNINKAR